MQTVLFHSTVFGPIHSRRLGTSLGVNLMPRDGKVCTFDCLYCEAGFNAQGPGKAGIPAREEVKRLLAEKLASMHAAGDRLDVITFSGNGEPTLHPDFDGVIDDTIELRDRYYPEARVSVLSNSTRLGSSRVVAALKKVDNNILKLDSAIDSTIRALDRPTSTLFTARSVIDELKQFGPQCIIQTMILRGTHDGHVIDNSTDAEI
ncbi:MAG: radical SAM protein, partial [Muribaculaceae bacterium]|nr:radical SAM protein [Muribaculaceae bacterium]